MPRSTGVYCIVFDASPSKLRPQATAHDAFRALVNLSDEPRIVPFLAERSFLAFLVSYTIVSHLYAS
jgi:hypothetical protein